MAKISLAGYGQNQGAVPSSITPTEDVARNPYAPSLSEAHESVIANGIASNPQVRKINTRADANVPAAFGHRNRGADTLVKVPAKTSRR